MGFTKRIAPAVLLLCMFLGAAHGQEGVKPWIGVLLAKEEGSQGARVDRVLEGAPAAKAGLRVGDVVLTVDGKAIDGVAGLIGSVQERGVGQRVVLGLARAGRPVTVTLALEARPDELQLMRDRLLGKPVPPFTLGAAVAGRGPALSSRALVGKVVVVELWATWCGPCRSAMPRVEDWERRFGAQGLAVVSVSEEPAAAVAKFHAGAKLHHALYRHEGLSASLFSSVVPTWIVIDRAGTVRSVSVGAGSVLDDVERAFVPLLGPPPAARARGR